MVWYIPIQLYGWQGNTSPPQHKGIQWAVVFGGGASTYTPGWGKIVPRNITLLVGEKLFRVI